MLAPVTDTSVAGRQPGATPSSLTAATMRIVDLSIPVQTGMQIYPGDPEVSIRQAATLEADGANLLALHLGSHSGTHVDSPYHFVADGSSLEECDLRLFTGPGVIVDLTGHEPRQPITLDDLRPYEDRLGPGTIVALRTDWSDRYFGTDAYLDHPYLALEVCRRLLELGVRTVAIDALNLDQTTIPGQGEETFPCHLLFLGAGGIFAENLTNLGAVDFEDPVLSLLPIRLGGKADGAPCRAVALQL
jgi:kynurenine formamidase